MTQASSQISPNLTDVFAYVDRHRQEFIERLIDYLRRPSISAHGIGMDEVTQYLKVMLEQLGLSAQIVPTAGWPVVLGRRTDAPGAPTVLLYGHYDVQPPDPLDEWISPPFEPSIRNGRIYARGVGDNKGQHLAQILALESLLRCRGQLPCNVILLLEGEEEIGSPQMPAFVQAHKDQLNADLVIIADGPVHASGRSQIVFGARGIITFELRARGACRDLHSGNWGGIAPNPLWTLVHLLSTMKSDRGDITIDGFYDQVVTPTEQEYAALANLPIDQSAIQQELGLQQFDLPHERPFAERAMWPIFTINGLHGGYGGEGSKTVLPHYATAKCDIRLVANQTAEDIFAKVEAHVRRHAPDVQVIWQGGMDPSKTPMDSEFTEAIYNGAIAAQNQPPLLVPTLGGSLPNYVFTKFLGIPVFLVPYANADEANHAPNENLEVDRFIMGIKTGAAMLAHIGAMNH
jgi:acetylornithine deacetylase/succinyl-diaminopimelate desuccinylase-like protein